MSPDLYEQLDVCSSMLKDAGQKTAAKLIDEALKQEGITTDQEGAVIWCNDAAKLLFELEDYHISASPNVAWTDWLRRKDELLKRAW